MRMEISYGLFSELLDGSGFSALGKHALYDWYEERQGNDSDDAPTPRFIENSWTEYLERDFVNKYSLELDDDEEWQALFKGIDNLTIQADFVREGVETYKDVIKINTTIGNHYLVMD